MMEIFKVSGPLHLLDSFDWGNDFHRTSLVASLIQGVYSLELEHQRGIQDYANASPWWEKLEFRLYKILKDDSDSSCFGAIYQNVIKDASPRYVIAFRGTVLKKDTICEDLKLNFKCLATAELQKSSRIRIALDAVRNTVEATGPANVWLAGHSLGASIAMLVGKEMAKSGYNLETYLFNPPLISLPIEKMIKNKMLKGVVRVANSLSNAVIAKALRNHHKYPEEKKFHELSKWVPYVFVNPNDLICAEYMGYFRHREKMEEIGIRAWFTEYSFASLVSAVNGEDMEPLHIVAAAHMRVNTNPSKNLRKAHGIAQWWQPNLEWDSKLYKFKDH